MALPDGVQYRTFDGEERLATRGEAVYGEPVVDGWRAWDAHRSKLGAMYELGMEPGLDAGDRVLYLGAANGTTASHVADVAGPTYAVEFAARPMRDLLSVAETRGEPVSAAQGCSKSGDLRPRRREWSRSARSGRRDARAGTGRAGEPAIPPRRRPPLSGDQSQKRGRDTRTGRCLRRRARRSPRRVRDPRQPPARPVPRRPPRGRRHATLSDRCRRTERLPPQSTYKGSLSFQPYAEQRCQVSMPASGQRTGIPR